VPLLADGVCLAHPGLEVRVQLVRRLDPECVEMIPWRERLHESEARVLEPPRENDMPVQPRAPRRDLGERHPDLKGDARLLGENAYWSDPLDDPDDAIEECANLRRLAVEMMIEIVNGAGVRLVAVRELSTALGAAPQRSVRHRHVSWHNRNMSSETALRELVSRTLAWEDAHVGFDAAVANIPVDLRGRQPPGVPYSPWQLVEHLRRAQHDILDFCRNPDYQELEWPDDYWPPSAEPPDPQAWDESIERYRQDRRALEEMAADPKTDLYAQIPHGSGQTYLRELLLVADHGAYHVGQLVLVRRLLGNWSGK
jgi:hypothetical protein